MDSLKIGADKSASLFGVDMDLYDQDEYLESLSKTATRKTHKRANILTKKDFGDVGDMDEYAETLTKEEKEEIENAKDKQDKEALKEKAKKKRVSEWNDRVKGENPQNGSETDTPKKEIPLQEARNKQFISRLNEWKQALNMIKARSGGEKTDSFNAAVENILSLMSDSRKQFSLQRVGLRKTPAYTKRLKTIKEMITKLDNALADLLNGREESVETDVLRNISRTSSRMLRYIDNEAGVAFEKGLVTTWATILEYSQGEYSEVKMKESKEEKEKREKERKKQDAAEEKERNKRIEKKKKEKQKEEKKQGKEVTKLEEIILTEEEEKQIDLEINEERQKREAERFDINKLIADGKEFASLRGNPSFVVTEDFMKQLAIIQTLNGITGKKESDFSNLIFVYEKTGDVEEENSPSGVQSEDSGEIIKDRKLILKGVTLKEKGRLWKPKSSAAKEETNTYAYQESHVKFYMDLFGLGKATVNSTSVTALQQCSIDSFESTLKGKGVSDDVVKRLTAQFVITKYRILGMDGFKEDTEKMNKYLKELAKNGSKNVKKDNDIYVPNVPRAVPKVSGDTTQYDMTSSEEGAQDTVYLMGDLRREFIKLFTSKTRLTFKGLHLA